METANNRNGDPTLALIQERAGVVKDALNEATEAVTGSPEHDPRDVFPDPKSAGRRRDVAFDKENVRDEQAFRVAMEKIGPGRETNISAEQAGLHDGYALVMEAGLDGKLKTQWNVAASREAEVKPGIIFLALDPARLLVGGEASAARATYGLDVASEYQLGHQMVSHQPEFVESPTGPQALPYSYDLQGNVALTSEGEQPSGQFVEIGATTYGARVVLMRVDRQSDPAEVLPYVVPSNKAKIKATAQISENPEVALATSTTYLPSNELQALAATLELRTESETEQAPLIRIVAYGGRALATVKGQDPNAPLNPVGLQQLASEAHATAKALQNLGELGVNV